MYTSFWPLKLEAALEARIGFKQNFLARIEGGALQALQLFLPLATTSKSVKSVNRDSALGRRSSVGLPVISIADGEQIEQAFIGLVGPDAQAAPVKLQFLTRREVRRE